MRARILWTAGQHVQESESKRKKGSEKGGGKEKERVEGGE